MNAARASLSSRLRNAGELSPTQQRIAARLQADLNEAALWGAEDLARETGTCVATVVRFARRLGYAGFLEMRRDLVASARRHYQDGRQLLEAPPQAAAALVEVARRDMRNIERLLRDVDEAMLAEATRMLSAARIRLALGDGVSALMASQLAYLLTHAGLPTLEGSPADFATQVGNLGPGDLLVAISLPPYTRETLDAAAYARKRGIPVLAFTDGPQAPLWGVAARSLPIPGRNLLPSHSLAAFGVLAHALATALARRDAPASLKKLREAERVARPKYRRGDE